MRTNFHLSYVDGFVTFIDQIANVLSSLSVNPAIASTVVMSIDKLKPPSCLLQKTKLGTIKIVLFASLPPLPPLVTVAFHLAASWSNKQPPFCRKFRLCLPAGHSGLKQAV